MGVGMVAGFAGGCIGGGVAQRTPVMTPSPTRIRDAVRSIADRYPERLRAWQREDIARQTFQVALATDGVPLGACIADIGAGYGLFPPACAALGYHAICVDDFSDMGDPAWLEVPQMVHQPLGVEIVSRDVVAEGICFPCASLDVVTTFATMEHFHHSPKRLFHQCLDALKPGGRFVIGVPNGENLRKRVMAPFGIAWTQMRDWYEPDVFRGHVREPNVSDLLYIAQDLGLVDVEVYGRNWMGYITKRPLVRAATPVLDRLLQTRPALCSEIYLVGHR
jgi:SAM-dependent methyltransferase